MLKEEIIVQSIDYMLLHINDELNVSDVASHFHYSESYFSHAFKAITGESVYSFMKHLKMDQSAIDIKLRKRKPLTDIGMEYGYSSSNYSSAFKLHHNISPSEFRESTNTTSITNPFHPEIQNCFENYETYNNKIKVIHLDSMRVIYEKVLGNYEDLKEKWVCFLDHYKNYIFENTTILERFFDDPTITSSNYCICDLCITVEKDCELENIITLDGGKFASYRFNGEIKDIFCTLQGIFAVWLPKSGYEMDKRYGFNIYHEIDIKNNSVIIDFCIPIK